MRTRRWLSRTLVAALFAAALADLAGAATGSATHVPIGIPRARKAAATKHAPAKPAATKAASPTEAKAADSKPAPRADAKATGPRTLQDIHIEGEIPVPQVLFITARDQRRFVEFQTQRYLKTSQQVGEQTAFPSRIAVTGNRPADPAKETGP